jgi:hypothetical protein
MFMLTLTNAGLAIASLIHRQLPMDGNNKEETLPWSASYPLPRERTPTPKANCLGTVC